MLDTGFDTVLILYFRRIITQGIPGRLCLHLCLSSCSMASVGSVVTPVEKVAETLMGYYRQADEWVASEEELLTWFATLAPHQRVAVHLVNPSHWLVLPECRRYVLQSRGYSLFTYLASHLTVAEFTYWLALADDLF